MITKYSLQVTYDKLQVEYERINNLMLKLPLGSSVRYKLEGNLNNIEGKMYMLQSLVKEAEN